MSDIADRILDAPGRELASRLLRKYEVRNPSTDEQ